MNLDRLLDRKTEDKIRELKAYVSDNEDEGNCFEIKMELASLYAQQEREQYALEVAEALNERF